MKVAGVQRLAFIYSRTPYETNAPELFFFSRCIYCHPRCKQDYGQNIKPETYLIIKI